jgi:uncharacterized protein (TIGR02453 family)
MKSAFPGFPPEGMQFLRGIVRNNHRDWFQPRKPVFEEKLKKPMLQLVEAVDGAMKRFAPDYVTEPNKAVYRFYRDTRFSKDKKPYKGHIAASFRHRFLEGEGGGAGFYFHVGPKEVGIGGGVYMPDPATLLAIRTHVAEFHEQLESLLKARAVKRLFGEMQGEQLTRVPKGFCSEHPAADLLRRKQYLLWAELPPAVATTPDLYKQIVEHFEAMTPFLEFLNAPLAAKGRKKPRIGARELLG